MWLSVLRQLCQRYPVFSLSALFDLATCWLWPFFHPPIVDKILFNNFPWPSHWLAFVLFLIPGLPTWYFIICDPYSVSSGHAMGRERVGTDTCLAFHMCLFTASSLPIPLRFMVSEALIPALGLIWLQSSEKTNSSPKVHQLVDSVRIYPQIFSFKHCITLILLNLIWEKWQTEDWRQ